MLTIAEAILPLVLLTAFGTGLKAVGFMDHARRSALESVVYFVLVPALIIRAMNRTTIDLAALLPLAATMLVPIGLILALAFALRAYGPPDATWLHGPGFPATVMGLTRNNIFIVFAASQALLGPDAGAITALAAMFYVPAVNIVGVVACTRYGEAATSAIWDTLRALASNPFILGTVAGLLLNVTGIGLPGPLEPAAALLSDSALGLALVCVGAGLTLPAVTTAPLGLVVTAVLKLLAMPFFAWLLCVWLQVEAALALAVMLYHAGPTAPGAYVLAKQLGGDADYMAALITAQTIAAAVTMPLVFAAARALYG